jgi:triacylglycerol lipase
MYSYAGPKVGNQAFANLYRSLIKHSIRFVNLDDIVPMLPPNTIYCPITDKSWDYKHVHGQVSFTLQTRSLGGITAFTLI